MHWIFSAILVFFRPDTDFYVLNRPQPLIVLEVACVVGYILVSDVVDARHRDDNSSFHFTRERGLEATVIPELNEIGRAHV